ncbi:cytochrome c3 family protein [Geobacter pickeringii]|uniref:cytochrome c3 family protein n=1 Tax=Geobacter pickeringii TaxID=345632 RepID=UPI0038B3D061
MFQRHDLSLKRPDHLDGRITLVDGKVGCLSCHNMLSQERSLLTINNNSSQLCLSCHER